MSLEKINSAKAVLEYIQDGMVIGLGSGTTIRELIKLLGNQVRNGLDIFVLPTSYDSYLLAMANGIRTIQPEQASVIDLTIDGADFISKKYLIKGNGGALTREKIVAYNSKKFFVIVGESKLKRKSFPVPLEVLPFASMFVIRKLKKIGYDSTIREAEKKIGPVITDNGNYLIDVKITNITNPKKMEKGLNSIPGVIENGIFTKFSKILIGTNSGSKIYKY